ncbi:uncharacterized protein CANTADRAFT_171448 [Suhomyces tanzawaensis NRRL Y-17324]|uniref:Inner centromere protein ARK-binding domain-containing protein n=1 Tax=Suhomyces tanzawaensis NRRL Y-17324 TaxID=984487 RepID=A0A1E4SMP4_9ASCO|nr:uncharacterized protein CANTADRAFT_171448 [Suhomyces tanzawaensis NRRL Y-17324]ODV80791.1 hypothetical protein CANTADRAFT_171448 [Suhomyces tanzawaensis NRRL Y-17324]
MSSQFWALNATKKRNELVPGTSKWVANELSTVNDVVLTHNEQVFQSLQEKLDHMNAFMRSVLDGTIALDAIRRDPSPSHFSYIHPTTTIPQSSPVKTAPPREPPTSKHTFPKTPSPVKPLPKTSPSIDSSFVPIARTIDPNKNAPPELTKVRSSLDDSFQAISTAIRKSIAGKSAIVDETKKPSPEVSTSKQDSSKKSTSKTPKRSSIFVSLPSREPITITAASKTSSKRLTGVKSRSLRVFERLDIASRRETSTMNKNMVLSPVAIPRSTPLTSLEYKLELLDSKPELPKPEYHDQKKPEIPSNTTMGEEKPKPENSRPASKSNTHPSSLNETKIPVLKKSLSNSSPKRENTPNGLIQSEINLPSYMRTTSSRSNSSSPVSSPPKHTQVKRSPRKSPVKISPTKTRSPAKKTEPEETSNESKLLNRLMAPTSSSAAKSKLQVVGGKVSKPANEIKKLDLSTKNRFLTTTLIPTSTPQFNPQKPPQFTSSKVSSKALVSPIQANKIVDEIESKTPMRLESMLIPSLKKKSMMAERSEAAAQKPKHKITISMNHKIDLKTSNPKGAPEKEQTDFIDAKKKVHKGELTKQSKGNSVALPEVARGNFGKTQESSKRRKIAKESQSSEPISKDILPNDLFKEQKTPGRSISKSQILGKKASRISGARTPFKNKFDTTNELETPGPITPGTLPEIHSDEDDDDNKYKVLKSWGHTPELHKIIMKNRNVDPSSVFGAVPKINIEEIFESQASRMRGKQSPYLSPNEKQRRHEERQYVLEMGYK